MKLKEGWKAGGHLFTVFVLLFFGLGWWVPELISAKSDAKVMLGFAVAFVIVGSSVFCLLKAWKAFKKTKVYKKYIKLP